MDVDDRISQARQDVIIDYFLEIHTPEYICRRMEEAKRNAEIENRMKEVKT